MRIWDNEGINKKIRKLNPTLYDVQVKAIKEMLNGNIVNVETGEGKTRIIYTLAVMKVLKGQSVVVITPNDYLNERDYKECKEFIKESNLNITVCLNGMDTDESRNNKELIYNSKIIYSTASEFVFDYLREIEDDNFVRRMLNKSLIIDEIDQILVDNSNTNYTISVGEGELIETSELNLYLFANQLVKNFKGGELTCTLRGYEEIDDSGYDFIYSTIEKFVYMTEKGENKIRSLLGGFNEKTSLSLDLHSAVLNILRAKYLWSRGVDYVIKEGEISLIDVNNGRFKKNNHYSSAYHLALEIKEGLSISKIANRNQSINGLFLFAQFNSLTGCSGTAWESRKVFKKILNKDTVKIERNAPARIIKRSHIVFKNREEKYRYVMEKVQELNMKGLPMLIVARNDVECIEFHSFLQKSGLNSLRLTNKDLENEFEIIEKSGEKNSILVSTLISGRGTDIKINEYISKIGGLQIIFLTRFENIRAETQIIGRTGRQGNHGVVYFYSSLDDYIYQYLNINKKNKLCKLVYKGINSGRRINKYIKSIQRMYSGRLVDSITNLYKKNAILHFAEVFLIQNGVSLGNVEIAKYYIEDFISCLQLKQEPFISNSIIKTKCFLEEIGEVWGWK